MDALKLKTVTTWWDKECFIALPWDLYKEYPLWTSPPRFQMRSQLSPKNPFFKHAQFKAFLVMQGNTCVGRIAATIDHDANTRHGERVCFFGYYDCVDDVGVSNLLIQAVQNYAREQAMEQLRGPINLGLNYECGLLIEGYDMPPSLMMLYHPPYYKHLLEQAGFLKIKDLYAYEFTEAHPLSDRMLRHLTWLQNHANIEVRPMDLSRFQQEVKVLHKIYNDAWENNWGFVPLSLEEFQAIAKDLKSLVIPKLCLIAYCRGEPVGFAMALPDLGAIFRKMPKGKLLFKGIFALAKYILHPYKERYIDAARVVTLGINKAYQRLGIGPILYRELQKNCVELKLKRLEASWILEDNLAINAALKDLHGKINKTYRLYQKPLSAP